MRFLRLFVCVGRGRRAAGTQASAGKTKTNRTKRLQAFVRLDPYFFGVIASYPRFPHFSVDTVRFMGAHSLENDEELFGCCVRNYVTLYIGLSLFSTDGLRYQQNS